MMHEGVRVDLDRKEELIMAKQIRQNTTKMLQRPSYYQSPEPKKSQDESWIRDIKRQEKRVSTPVLEALLTQKKEGKLTSSALDAWLKNLGAQFDDHYEQHEKLDNKINPNNEEDAFWKNIKNDKVEVEFGTCQSEEDNEYKRKQFVDKLQAQLNEKRRKREENAPEKDKLSTKFTSDQSESDKEVKKKGRVNKFEAELNQCYVKREEEKQRNWLENVETEFDRCFNECHAMDHFDIEDSKNNDLDIVVPKNELLDSSFAKHKVVLNRRKSLTSVKKSKANNEISEGDEMVSPRLSIREQRTNAARKHHEEKVKDSIVLGKEPDVVQMTHAPKNKSFFGMMYSSIDRKQRKNPFYATLERKKTINNKTEPEKVINKPDNELEHPEDPCRIPELPEAPKRKKYDTAKVKNINPFIDDENAYEEVEYPQIKLKMNSTKSEDNKINRDVMNCSKTGDTIDFIKTDTLTSKSTHIKTEKHDKPTEGKKPFQAVNDCLFSCYASCVPWCIAKRFYWKTHS